MPACLLLLLLLLVAGSAESSVVARIPHALATGETGLPAFAIDLYAGVGFDISLLATDEQLSAWWVEDPSRVVARAAPGAKILNLRLAALPTVLPSNRHWTTVKLLVQTARGGSHLMTFLVRLHPKAPDQPEQLRYHGLEVLPAAGPTLLR